MSDMLLSFWIPLQNRIARDETGATAVEYGMMVALIAAVIVVAVGLLGTKVNAAFTTINQHI
jgi:pilus assembly protein Flp/PilA